MKKYYTFFLISLFSLGYAQDFQRESIENIASDERKSASKIRNLVVNQNTADYDVTYQKLELTVNPAVRFISSVPDTPVACTFGSVTTSSLFPF